MRIRKVWNVSESLGMEEVEDLAIAIGRVQLAADRVLASRAFAEAVYYALSLPSHKYGVGNRPEYPLKWDRKAWSHLHYFVELEVPLDPGNVVLACCLQALMCRCGTVVQSKDMRLCDKCNLERGDVLAQFESEESCADLVRLALARAQQKEENMQVENMWTWQKIEAMGDVIEAVGGICHAWRRESTVI